MKTCYLNEKTWSTDFTDASLFQAKVEPLVEVEADRKDSQIPDELGFKVWKVCTLKSIQFG